VIEDTVYNEITLYPLMMEKFLVQPLAQSYVAMNNRNVGYYTQLLKSIEKLQPDIYPSPTLNERALRSISQWDTGREPFQTVVSAKDILSM